MKTMKMMMRTMRKTSQMPPAVHPQRTAVIRTRTECPPPPCAQPPLEGREGMGREGEGLCRTRPSRSRPLHDASCHVGELRLWPITASGVQLLRSPPRRHGDSSSTGGETASGPHEVVSGGEWQLVHCHTSPPPPAQETFTQLDNFWCCFVFLFFFFLPFKELCYLCVECNVFYCLYIGVMKKLCCLFIFLNLERKEWSYCWVWFLCVCVGKVECVSSVPIRLLETNGKTETRPAAYILTRCKKEEGYV